MERLVCGKRYASAAILWSGVRPQFQGDCRSGRWPGSSLESDLVAEQELASGRLVRPLREVSHSVRYVGHYLVHPRRPTQPHAVTQFKEWLFKELAVN